jgi:uncharacterized LabA/DUF88 family protein
MVFIDGTNTIKRLEKCKLKQARLFHIISNVLRDKIIVRMYLYSIQKHIDDALKTHGHDIFSGIRIVLGHGIEKDDGNIKEKGVDALLVADLIYHAAMKNFDYALVVSVDTDFVFALHRIEDFGCRTGVMGLGIEVPQRLCDSCDEVHNISKEVFCDS